MVKIKNVTSSVLRLWDGTKGKWIEFRPNEEKELESFNGTDGFKIVLPKKAKKEEI